MSLRADLAADLRDWRAKKAPPMFFVVAGGLMFLLGVGFATADGVRTAWMPLAFGTIWIVVGGARLGLERRHRHRLR